MYKKYGKYAGIINIYDAELAIFKTAKGKVGNIRVISDIITIWP